MLVGVLRDQSVLGQVVASHFLAAMDSQRVMRQSHCQKALRDTDQLQGLFFGVVASDEPVSGHGREQTLGECLEVGEVDVLDGLASLLDTEGRVAAQDLVFVPAGHAIRLVEVLVPGVLCLDLLGHVELVGEVVERLFPEADELLQNVGQEGT